MQKIRVAKESDRLALVSILAANGYIVWIDKERKPNSKISVTCALYQDKEEFYHDKRDPERSGG